MLDHFVRGQIYGYIVAHPGTTYTELKRALRVANGSLTYHLHVLARMGFIQSERLGKYRVFYPEEMPDGRRRGMVLSNLQGRILSRIRTTPGIAISELASALHMRKQNVSYNVGRLREWGLIRVEGVTRRRCYPKER